MQDNPGYSLTPEEVARQLQIKKNTVYELVKRGTLPAYRIGRKLRFDQRDVDMFKQKGKSVEFSLPVDPSRQAPNQIEPPLSIEHRQELIICGQDIILDILARHLERHTGGQKVWRNNASSFDGLIALYHNQANMAAVHLWDAESGTYNIAHVRRLLPGIPSLLINLAIRMQGFYVQTGNPKSILEWHDLIRPGVRFINREKGSGTRILLDEKFHSLGLNRLMIQGYELEEFSHLAVASKVARGEADVTLGNQKAAMQVRGIEFVPLISERYDLVMKREDAHTVWYRAVINIINSAAFLDEIKGLGDYDLSQTGQMTEL